MNQDFIVTSILRIVMVGKEEYPDSHVSFSPDITCNELVFHFSGQTTLVFDGKVYETRDNTVRFLPKGRASSYDVYIHKPDECILIDFQTDLPVAESAFVLNGAQNESIGPLFQKIFSLWVSKAPGYYFACISLLYKILSELQKPCSHAPIDHQRKIQPGVDLLLDGFLRNDITIGMLAASCGISESYFKRLFKEKYGVPPKKYLTQLKLRHACDLLRLERYSVTQIAEMSNFSDVYFFSRQFKEYMGITPSAFIEKYKSSK